MRRLILFLALATLFTLSFAEVVNISGSVSSMNDWITPIEGATIQVENIDEQVITDENGYYTIDVDWVWNGPIVVTCIKEGYTSVTETLFPEHPYEYLDFFLEVLVPTNVIQGNVYYTELCGNTIPIAGAFISVGGVENFVETDANGFYSIEFIWNWDSAVVMNCEHIDYETIVYSFFPSENPATVDFEMIPLPLPYSHSISGNVSDITTGSPIVDVEIHIDSVNENVYSDSNGNYQFMFNWDWDSAVIITCSHAAYESQIVSFYPDSEESYVNFTLSTEANPAPITIQGFVTQAYPNNDQPIEGAVLSFGAPGADPVAATRTETNGFYTASLVWNWYGPIQINCHYPGHYHIVMDCFPDGEMNDLNFFMQPLPPVFEPPANLSGYVSNDDRVVLEWSAPMNWPLEHPLSYRIYIKENDNQYFHPLATTSLSEFVHTFSVSGSGTWNAEFTVTVFEDSTETAFSNIITLGHTTANDGDVQVLQKPILDVYPNPFNPSANIFLNIQEHQHVKAQIFNIKGQTIETLLDMKLQEGSHNLVWDGTDSNGSKQSSGIYFLKVRTGSGVSLTRKLTLIK